MEAACMRLHYLFTLKKTFSLTPVGCKQGLATQSFAETGWLEEVRAPRN
jgi:hypothetical protein